MGAAVGAPELGAIVGVTDGLIVASSLHVILILSIACCARSSWDFARSEAARSVVSFAVSVVTNATYSVYLCCR